MGFETSKEKGKLGLNFEIILTAIMAVFSVDLKVNSQNIHQPNGSQLVVTQERIKQYKTLQINGAFDQLGDKFDNVIVTDAANIDVMDVVALLNNGSGFFLGMPYVCTSPGRPLSFRGPFAVQTVPTSSNSPRDNIELPNSTPVRVETNTLSTNYLRGVNLFYAGRKDVGSVIYRKVGTNLELMAIIADRSFGGADSNRAFLPVWAFGNNGRTVFSYLVYNTDGSSSIYEVAPEKYRPKECLPGDSELIAENSTSQSQWLLNSLNQAMQYRTIQKRY
jgi:hypothetical protein